MCKETGALGRKKNAQLLKKKAHLEEKNPRFDLDLAIALITLSFSASIEKNSHLSSQLSSISHLNSLPHLSWEIEERSERKGEEQRRCSPCRRALTVPLTISTTLLHQPSLSSISSEANAGFGEGDDGNGNWRRSSWSGGARIAGLDLDGSAGACSEGAGSSAGARRQGSPWLRKATGWKVSIPLLRASALETGHSSLLCFLLSSSFETATMDRDDGQRRWENHLYGQRRWTCRLRVHRQWLWWFQWRRIPSLPGPFLEISLLIFDLHFHSVVVIWASFAVMLLLLLLLIAVEFDNLRLVV